MPRPPRPWFRFYSESLTNRKVQEMGREHPALFVQWVNLMALANISRPRGKLPQSIADIAFALRVTESEAGDFLNELKERHLVDVKAGRFEMHDWREWQPDSDANLTPARATRAERARNERGMNAKLPRNERIDIEVDVEKEKETETDADADAEDARPPEHPFAFMYAQKYRMREGRPIPPVVHAAALALEREFGSQACIDAAADFDWQKHPNYLKPGLEERRNGTASRPKTARNVSGRSAGGGAASGDFGLEDWKRYDADRPRSPAAATT